MPRRVGQLAVCGNRPHIYFIVVAERFVYIGETQINPPQRWGQHLSPAGTFVGNVKEVDEEVLGPGALVQFFAYECTEIMGVPEHERRIVTQFVEHQLHVRFVEDGVLGSRYRLVSDTTRSRPRRIAHIEVGIAQVDAVFALFLTDSSLTAQPAMQV